MRLAFGERDDRLLGVALSARMSLERLELALADKRVDGLDLDVEQALDRRLDLGLGRARATLKTTWLCSETCVDFSVIDRPADHVVACVDALAHLKRASSASTAALVSTSFLRRRMS